MDSIVFSQQLSVSAANRIGRSWLALSMPWAAFICEPFPCSHVCRAFVSKAGGMLYWISCPVFVVHCCSHSAPDFWHQCHLVQYIFDKRIAGDSGFEILCLRPPFSGRTPLSVRPSFRIIMAFISFPRSVSAALGERLETR